MRTHLFRGVVALAVLLRCPRCAGAGPERRARQSRRRAGQAGADATVLFEATDANRKTQTKTDKNGDFLQVGLRVRAPTRSRRRRTASARRRSSANVRQGPNNPLNFTLSSRGGGERGGGQGSGCGAAGAARRGRRSDEGRPPRRGDRQVQRGDRQDADLRRLLLQHRRRAYVAKQDAAGRSGVQEGDRAEAGFTPRPTPAWPTSTTRRRSSTSRPRPAPRRRSCQAAAGGGGNPKRSTTRASSCSTPASSPRPRRSSRRRPRPTRTWRWRTISSA